MLAHVKGHVLQRLDAAKRQHHVLYGKDHIADVSRGRHVSGGLPGGDVGEYFGLFYAQVGADLAGAPILKTHLRFDEL